jgi:hypothetical protein
LHNINDLIGALGKQTQRSPMIVERDFHSSATGKMTRVGDMSLTSNPVSKPWGCSAPRSRPPLH